MNTPFISIGNTTFTLTELESEIWVSLNNGSKTGRDGFHTFVFANRNADLVELRTVVLREISIPDKTVYCYTDSRSPKVTQLKSYPEVSLLFYDKDRKMQLRMLAIAQTFESGLLVDEHWAKSRLNSKKCYLSEYPPGTVLSLPGDGIDENLLGRDPNFEESEKGRANFVVIAFQIKTIDWLYLNSYGHRRAFFEYSESRTLKSMSWLNP